MAKLARGYRGIEASLEAGCQSRHYAEVQFSVVTLRSHSRSDTLSVIVFTAFLVEYSPQSDVGVLRPPIRVLLALLVGR